MRTVRGPLCHDAIVERMESHVIARLGGVRHGFFTRAGGVSHGIYASLNCGPGSGDDPARVAENRARVMAALRLAGGARAPLNTLAQIHSAEVVTLDAPLPAGRHPRADALVTATPGIAVGVLAADCVPVLMADTGGAAVGAAHAGWKGALGGVIEATVAALGALGVPAQRLVACVGPSIQQTSYEVGAELRDRFLADDPENRAYFERSDRDGGFAFDLPAYVAARVEATGVAEVERMMQDTYSQESIFFSYRRATHRSEPDYGRQVSVIALAD